LCDGAHEAYYPPGNRLDFGRAALLAAGLVAVLIPLVEGQRYGWPLWTWTSVAAADVILTGFVLHQRRVKRSGGEPLLDLSLLRARGVSTGLAAQLALALRAGVVLRLPGALPPGRAWAQPAERGSRAVVVATA
jgi:hypothetical protein